MGNNLIFAIHTKYLSMSRYLHILLLSCIFQTITAQITESKLPFQLGEDTVYIVTFSSLENQMYKFVHVHENETTALEAGKKFIGKYGGRLVTISHSKNGEVNRNVTFKYKKSTYQFDPNRIYTQDKNVLKKSISKVSGWTGVNDEVINMVQKFAMTVWQQVNDAELIIALHNNKNEPAMVKRRWLFFNSYTPESYNITSYMKKFDEENSTTHSCSDIYVNPNINNSEFFIVTQAKDFTYFVEKRWNVVLQNQNPVDDGSMSVYAAKMLKRYINAEAKLGRFEEQWNMLQNLPK